MTRRPWISAILLAAVVVIVHSQAWAVSRQETRTLIDHYGKGALIDLVRQLRENRITISINGRLRQFTGPPATEFVTIDTLYHDLEETGKSVNQVRKLLEPLLASQRAEAAKESSSFDSEHVNSEKPEPPDHSIQPKRTGVSGDTAQQLEEAALECRLGRFIDFMSEKTGARVKRFEALRDRLDAALEALYSTAHRLYGERINRNDDVVQFTIEGDDPRWTQILGPQWSQLREQMPDETPYFMVQVTFDWQDECRTLQRFIACLNNPQHCRGDVVGDSAVKLARANGSWGIVDAKSPAEWQQAFVMGSGLLEVLGWARRHVDEHHNLSTPYEEMVLQLAEGYFQRLQGLMSNRAKST